MSTDPSTTPTDPFDAAFLQRLPRLSLAYRGRVTGNTQGGRRSTARGPGTEFTDHRPLGKGDSLRQVNWKAYARTGRLFVRTFQQESQAHVGILLDCSASMGVYGGSKLDLGKRVAALLCHVALQGRDRVVVSGAQDSSVRQDRPRSGLHHLHGALHFLRGLQARGKTDLRAGARSLRQAGTGQGLSVIISDLLDPRGFADCASHLQRLGHQVQVVHVTAPEELRPPLSGSCELVDSETSELIAVNFDGDARARYQQAWHVRQAAIAKHFARSRTVYVPVLSSEPLSQVLLRLQRQGVVVR